MTNPITKQNHTPEALIYVSSHFSVTETADRFSQQVQEKGLTLFSRVDHSANAKEIDQELPPTQVIVFGNPLVGTKLMKSAPTVAIDLPQKALIWQDESGQTQIAYNNPYYLKHQHNIEGCDEILEKVSTLLAALSNASAE